MSSSFKPQQNSSFADFQPKDPSNLRRTSLTAEDKSDIYSIKTTTASNMASMKTHDFSTAKVPEMKLGTNNTDYMKSRFAMDFKQDKLDYKSMPTRESKENDQPPMGGFFPPNSFLRDPNMSTATANFDGGSAMRPRENLQTQESQNRRAPTSKYLPTNPGNNLNSSLQNIMRANERPFSQINLNNNGNATPGNYKRNVLNVQAELMNYDEDFLPEDCLFLLGEEDNNLASFRENVEKEKARLASDMDLMMRDVMNLFEENKVKLQENIDLHYKNYLQKYGQLKDMLIEFKNMKLDMPSKKIHPNFNLDLTNASNSNLIRELEDLRYQNQMSKMFNYITALQREKLAQIVNYSKELLQLSTQIPNYYNSEAFGGFLKELKAGLSTNFTKRMQNVNDFVKSLLPKVEPMPMPMMNVNMNTMTSYNFAENPDYMNSQMPGPSPNNPLFSSPFPLNSNPMNSYPNSTNINTNSNPMSFPGNPNSFLNENPTKPNGFQEDLKLYESKQTLSNTLYKTNPFSKPSKLSAQHPDNKPNQCLSISNDHLTAKFASVPSQLNMELSHVFKTGHEDILLCLHAVSEDLIAVGSKDATVSLWRLLSRSRVSLLEGHKGSICSLTSLKTPKTTYLFSGSDHEDGSIIVWDLQTMSLVNRLVGHNAAVVALVALSDAQTLISGSYDKEVVIWNMFSGKAVQKLAGHNSSITALALARDQLRLVSASLDNTLNVWKLNYKEAKGSQSFESCYLERTIKNNTFVCSVNILSDNKTLVSGSKDGKLKFWNLENGECDRVLTANLGPIVEVLVLEGANAENEGLGRKEVMNNVAVVSCSSKDQNLVMTNVGNGVNGVVDVQGKAFIEYGCGVNPKIQMLKVGEECEMVVINQSEREKVFSVWKIRMV